MWIQNPPNNTVICSRRFSHQLALLISEGKAYSKIVNKAIISFGETSMGCTVKVAVLAHLAIHRAMATQTLKMSGECWIDSNLGLGIVHIELLLLFQKYVSNNKTNMAVQKTWEYWVIYILPSSMVMQMRLLLFQVTHVCIINWWVNESDPLMGQWIWSSGLCG